MNSAIVFASPGPPPLFFLAHSLLSRSILLMPGRNALKVSSSNLCILYVALFARNLFIKQINVQQWPMVHSWTLIA